MKQCTLRSTDESSKSKKVNFYQILCNISLISARDHSCILREQSLFYV